MTGVLPLLKPPGMTSQQAVSHVKSLLGVTRAGHAGTLDPGACGVLPVMIGRATKLSAHLMHEPKAYIAEMLVGVQTDTLDTYGRVVAADPHRFDARALTAVLPDFLGPQLQVPPHFAAIKRQGKPLYALAREGTCPQVGPRRVHIDELRLLHQQEEDRFLLYIACRQGTYIRALIRDLAAALDTVAVTSFLLRIQAGGFSIQDTVTFPELAQGKADLIRRPEEILRLPRLHLPAHLYPVLDSGGTVDLQRLRGLQAAEDTPYELWCRGVFFGIGQRTGDGLKLTVRLKAPDIRRKAASAPPEKK